MNERRVPAGGADDEYSATELASHWFERPGENTESDPDRAAAPDRVEGDVLRFGPGVTAFVRQRGSGTTAVDLWSGTSASPPAGTDGGRRRRGLRRYALAAAVLAAVLGFLAWQRYGPAVAVREVRVTTSPAGPGCDGTADVVGVVRTDGRPGTLTYYWVRSDGTSSGPLRERVARGQKQARLHLLWTFHGRGEYRAGAELWVTSPSRHTASAHFMYRC
ncbi:hypothetical protein ABZ070_26270 [Streptomyces sp. NPDC006283]|uniref:hypothetical protein n=1 Tax=Streptomyces sp. NPDC006283 TaxID=3156741 RepID=UPI0033A3B8C9